MRKSHLEQTLLKRTYSSEFLPWRIRLASWGCKYTMYPVKTRLNWSAKGH